MCSSLKLYRQVYYKNLFHYINIMIHNVHHYTVYVCVCALQLLHCYKFMTTDYSSLNAYIQ